MRGIFLLYMPPRNMEAMTHYRDTIQNRVPLDRIASLLTGEEVARLRGIFGSRPIAIWGSRDSSANRQKFSMMEEGDDLLIVEGPTIKLLGKIAMKTVNARLSRELWANLTGTASDGWDLIYFIANPLAIDIPFAEILPMLGYEAGYQLRGFTSVARERTKRLNDQYGELYSVLQRIKSGLPVHLRAAVTDGELIRPEQLALLDPERGIQTEPPDTADLSEHVRMQWTLLSLGRKTGGKVWVPVGDQTRLRQAYDCGDFEPQFASGIDLPHSYVENIDVVWKEEFRIDAAFEIENSTAIYSGLLRFADLSILAPNSNYPMFIVAPAAKRNQVRQQLRRPSFLRLGLKERVRFLPYEVVDEISEFFKKSKQGLTAEIVAERAEILS